MCVCVCLKRPRSPLFNGSKIQTRKPADGDGKSEFHTGDPLIFKTRRVSTPRSV